mmetsp:Transcript_26580/g.73087  ORF Transcript_26580/g.73087 Transcript_26580/m.73087 type:complete len:211 (+) Transcript_26580:870-1502(+)
MLQLNKIRHQRHQFTILALLELLQCPLLCHSAILQHENAICEFQRLCPVRNDQQTTVRRAAGSHGILEGCLSLGIHGRRGLVQNQKYRIRQEGSGEPDALALAATHLDAVSSHGVVQASLELRDKLAVCAVHGLAHIGFRCIGTAVANVLEDCRVEQSGSLWYQLQQANPVGSFEIRDGCQRCRSGGIGVIQGDAAGLGRVNARKDRGCR